MSADEVTDKEEIPRKKTPAEKSHENIVRIKRSGIASAMGIITGAICFYAIDPSLILGLQPYTIFALLIMIAGVVVQKHIFMILRLDPASLGWKGWFYQGFMTFAFWFITWTILLTSAPLA